MNRFLFHLCCYLTWVNGTNIKNEQKKLSDGDTLRMGGIEFIFESLQLIETVTENSDDIPSDPPYLQLDKQAMQVIVAGKIVTPSLTPLQWRIIELLYNNQGKVCSRDQIMEVAWQIENSKDLPYDGALHTHISNLRDRLHLNKGNQPPCIETIRTVGYRLVLK